MKKLLSLLSVLTISGTAVPTTIAASPYQKEEKLNSEINYLQTNNLENLNRNKRSNKCPKNDKLNYFILTYQNEYVLTLRPELVEEILGNMHSKYALIKVMSNNDFEEFKSLTGKEQYVVVESGLTNSAGNIRRLWKDDEFENNKKHAIKLVFYKENSYNGFLLKFEKDLSSKLTNKGLCPNKYLDKLKIDFPDWDKEEIYLGLIDEDTDADIKKQLKQKYPDLILDNIEIIEKKDYDHFSKNQSFKIKTIGSESKLPGDSVKIIKYSIGKLKPKFFYMSKTKIKELSNKMQNHLLIKQWLEHVKDYGINLETKITSLKQLNFNQKLERKNIEKEIIKGYIRDLSQNIEIIENEWKIDALNNTINGIKKDINTLKEAVSKIETEILNKINTPNLSLNCANIATVVAGGAGGVSAFATSTIIPVIGTIAGAVFTIVAGSCAIANA